MRKPGPDIPVAALPTIMKVSFRLSMDIVHGTTEQIVSIDSGEMSDPGQFRALLLRKDTQRYAKIRKYSEKYTHSSTVDYRDSEGLFFKIKLLRPSPESTTICLYRRNSGIVLLEMHLANNIRN